MTINTLIRSTLLPLGVPVSFLNYNQSADTYIVFNEYNQAPWLSADDHELWTKHYFQVDVFSSGNYLQLCEDVKSRLREVGFTRMYESETYDNDMMKFRKILRFHYISNKGEIINGN